MPQFSQQRDAPPPKLPATIALPDAGRHGGDRVALLHRPGGERRRPLPRARLDRAAGAATYLLIVATSLSDVDSTLHRLLLIELLVTAAVLAAIAVLGLWVVRLGLRPLDAIGETAAAIAAGDLSQRVERADERTEVGRLGLALNAMLGADRDGVPGARGVRARSCAASSPTPRTSCARRSPPCAPTPSCSRAAPPSGPTTSSAR